MIPLGLVAAIYGLLFALAGVISIGEFVGKRRRAAKRRAADLAADADAVAFRTYR